MISIKVSSVTIVSLTLLSVAESASARFLSVDPKQFSPKDVQTFNRYAYGNNNPYKYVDPDGREVSIVINRTTYSNNSIISTVHVSSDKVNTRFSGYTLEDSKGGDLRNKDPIAAGTYDAFKRTRASGKEVIELKNVPDYTNVQVHTGNTADDVKGCFAAGETSSTDFVGNSGDAMTQILDIVAEDGTGDISVQVNGESTQPAPQNNVEEPLDIF